MDTQQTTTHDWETSGCPKCNSLEVQEEAVRFTWQPMTINDGEPDYDSFDYADEPLVLGHSCRECEYDDSVANVAELLDAYRKIVA